MLGGDHRIHYDMDRDMLWRYDMVLKTHPNGMRFSCYDEDGTLLATNEYFSVGGGFVVNDKTKGQLYAFTPMRVEVLTVMVIVDENLFYKGVDKKAVHGARLQQSHSLSEPVQDTPLITGDCDPTIHPVTTTSSGKEQEQSPEVPPYPFDTGATLLALTQRHNVRPISHLNLTWSLIRSYIQQMTIAQVVHDNEVRINSTETISHHLNLLWLANRNILVTQKKISTRRYVHTYSIKISRSPSRDAQE